MSGSGSRGRALAVLAGAAGLAAVALALEFPLREFARSPAEFIASLRYSPSALGDGGDASQLVLADPMGLAIGACGELYVSDRGRDRVGRIIWRIDPDGTAHRVAGTGRRGKSRDGTGALRASLGGPEGLAIGPGGELHFADAGSHRVLRIEADGRLTVVAGTGRRGFGGDGGPATLALLNNPADIRFDAHGNLYIADVYNHRVRRVTPAGRIETVAGTGTPGFGGDGGPATAAELNHPWGLAVDPFTGHLLIADGDNHRVREVDAEGRIGTRIGAGIPGFAGDGGDARAALFDAPQSLGFDCAGRLYVGDEHNHAIRVVAANGTVTTWLGTGEPGFAADGSAGSAAPLNDPENLLVLCDGALVVTDGDNGRVLRVSPAGVVRNVAGRGRRAPPAGP